MASFQTCIRLFLFSFFFYRVFLLLLLATMNLDFSVIVIFSSVESNARPGTFSPLSQFPILTELSIYFVIVWEHSDRSMVHSSQMEFLERVLKMSRALYLSFVLI